jgi:hypothetical protein
MCKKLCIFAASYILIGGRIRLYAAGIFYALSLLAIYGFVTPCGALMRPLADKVYDNGKCGTVFLFPPQQIILSVMSYTEKIVSRPKDSRMASTFDYESVKNQFSAFCGNNLYLFSLLKAMWAFLEEERKGYHFSEARLMKAIEAARVLFHEDRVLLSKMSNFINVN